MLYIDDFVWYYFEHLDSFGNFSSDTFGPLIESFAMIPPSNTIEDINLDEGTMIVATIVIATGFAIDYGLRLRRKRANCRHEWKDLRSTTQILVFHCSMCNSGPHWMIWVCKNCGIKRCQTCKRKP